ncbi:MAG TPA: PAS domain S-box protein [Thermoguttaceae bacterium]|nr:PAS domain S-box protein [Thermoguttaceae bacterium]
MKSRSKLVWKLTAVAAAILAAAIALAPYVHVLIPLLLGIVALWFMFGLMLERPIRELIEGTKQIAAHRLDFRFDRKRHDEIGLLEESFNAMTATIQASQEELRDAKEYLEGMVENSADIIITVNTEGLIETFNRGGEEALGYRRAEVIGKPIESLFVESRERYDATVRLRKTGHVKNYETRLLTKDGQSRNVLLTLSYLSDSDGEPIGTIGISKDITQEKKFQDELRGAKEYLEAMVENSADIIITVDSEGLIKTFNRGGEESLGYRRQEVIGRRIESLFVDPRERHAAAARLEQTGNVINYETSLLAKDGRVRNVLLTLSRLRNVEGRPIGTIGISKDVTREKGLQRELIQSQKFAAIGQAVTGIQHAVKNMLDALNGGAYLVRNGMAKDNRQRIEKGCAMVEEGIIRISSLSRNMLNFAKEWKPELESVDLNDLVVSICKLNRQTAADHGITLRHATPDGLPPVLCDPKLIHIGTTDILVNAIDACNWKHYHDGETPEIVLENSLGKDRDTFVIRIRDNGCGMTEAVQRSIFVPFFSTKKTLGTGLGLALTARIVRVHGGVISVESEPERGTTFEIHLPVNGPGDHKEADDGQASPRS